MLIAAEIIVDVPTTATTIQAVRETIGSVPQMLVTVAATDNAIGTSPATNRITDGSRRGGGGGGGGGACSPERGWLMDHSVRENSHRIRVDGVAVVNSLQSTFIAARHHPAHAGRSPND